MYYVTGNTSIFGSAIQVLPSNFGKDFKSIFIIVAVAGFISTFFFLSY